ncbi:CDGSH iron-sulfur domain-containing protein [Streptomyces sp. ISL-86]|uniref:CDGSH iron-sulfur domain-containing protein n=1 Tax=Streptomyces sp. ISL-86 TaxID=2819187 RepID=UPI001BE6C882|nr:CDGSH iron-sulfur domain-containing protein [Streptomyces sp. ISL-86]MBT2459848.1 CDGSH iron-sulfur domain-containing protein [Streptomyces sp. ISL-86]
MARDRAAAGSLPAERNTGTPRRITQPDGPELVAGPVERSRRDGSIARSERPVVALCTCRRSRIYPWCDTSHRVRVPDRASREE